MNCGTTRWLRLIDRLFVDGRIAPWRFRRLWSHLAACESCRAYYDRAATAWEAMGRGAVPPQIAEAQAEALIAKATGEPARRVSIHAWFGAGFGALAAGAVGLWLVIGPTPAGDFIARGGADGGSRVRGVRAFCLARGADGGVAVRGSIASNRPGAPAGPPLACRLGEEIQFAYSLGAGAPESLAIAARDSSGGVIPWAPPRALRADVIDEPLDGLVHLAAYRPGPLTVAIEFTRSDAPGAVLERQELRVLVEP